MCKNVGNILSNDISFSAMLVGINSDVSVVIMPSKHHLALAHFGRPVSSIYITNWSLVTFHAAALFSLHAQSNVTLLVQYIEPSRSRGLAMLQVRQFHDSAAISLLARDCCVRNIL